MVWKQDLAKLKQQLKEDEGEPPRPVPVPKPPPPPGPPKSLGEEDAMFLAAMGQRAPALEEIPVPGPSRVKPEPPPLAADIDFQAALGDLSGLKTLARNPLLSAPNPPPMRPPQKGQMPPSPGFGQEIPEAPAPSPASLPAPLVPQEVQPPKMPPGPRLIHLAAGMAVEVDGVLDLNGHTVSDAKERLKERLQDAGVLGWRTLHVLLGPSEALRQAFLAFLLSPQAKVLAQYAQAPIPMGGSQAFIIYFSGPTA